ncbi:hypothetical protein [Streptomyces sp. NPDC056987]|uniref:hypothetical protein n=1 Tax=Streptomyces sp. NPDC056987 TaxID=3345988 RepID=UPI00362CE1AD
MSTHSTTKRRRLPVRAAATAALTGALVLGSQAGTANAATTVAVDANTTGLNTWLQDNALNIGILVVGILIVFSSRKKDMASALTMGGISLFGLAIVGMSTGGTPMEVGTFLIGLIGINGKA